MVAPDGRAFELTAWHDEHDHSKFNVEESRELDEEGRSHHLLAIHAALVWLSQEAPDSADPIEVLTEGTRRFTRAMRADEDWSPFREFVTGRGVDPQESILVDYGHRLASDSPPERTGTAYFRGKWFMFIGAVDPFAWALIEVKEWHEIDETEARIRHGARVDAALRIAALEKGRSTA